MRLVSDPVRGKNALGCAPDPPIGADGVCVVLAVSAIRRVDLRAAACRRAAAGREFMI
jgi:hypothetical protein